MRYIEGMLSKMTKEELQAINADELFNLLDQMTEPYKLTFTIEMQVSYRTIGIRAEVTHYDWNTFPATTSLSCVFADIGKTITKRIVNLEEWLIKNGWKYLKIRD